MEANDPQSASSKRPKKTTLVKNFTFRQRLPLFSGTGFSWCRRLVSAEGAFTDSTMHSLRTFLAVVFLVMAPLCGRGADPAPATAAGAGPAVEAGAGAAAHEGQE